MKNRTKVNLRRTLKLATTMKAREEKTSKILKKQKSVLEKLIENLRLNEKKQGTYIYKKR